MQHPLVQFVKTESFQYADIQSYGILNSSHVHIFAVRVHIPRERGLQKLDRSYICIRIQSEFNLNSIYNPIY